eukprot:30224-Pelagococcus_subviridis.AAC.4
MCPSRATDIPTKFFWLRCPRNVREHALRSLPGSNKPPPVPDANSFLSPTMPRFTSHSFSVLSVDADTIRSPPIQRTQSHQRPRRVPQVVRVDLVVRAPERDDVRVHGRELHGAHVRALTDARHGRRLRDAPHANGAVVGPRDEARRIQLRIIQRPRALPVLVKLAREDASVRVPQVHAAVVVRARESVLDVRVPRQRRELRVRLDLGHRAVHRGAELRHDGDFEHPQPLGDAAGGDVLAVAVPPRAAHHLPERVHVPDGHVRDDV